MDYDFPEDFTREMKDAAIKLIEALKRVPADQREGIMQAAHYKLAVESDDDSNTAVD